MTDSVSVTRAKILNKKVLIDCEIDGAVLKYEDPRRQPPESFRQAMLGLLPICESVVASKSKKDVMEPYALRVTYNDDGDIQTATVSAKLHVDGDDGVSLTLNYPRLSIEAENELLYLRKEHVELLEAVVNEARSFVFTGKQLNLFAKPVSA